MFEFAAVPFVLFASFLYITIRINKKIRARSNDVLNENAAALRSSVRWTFLLGGCVFCLAIPAVAYNMRAANLAMFLTMDMITIKNTIHAGFMIAGYSNFVMTGNPRYMVISACLLVMMIAACTTSSSLTLIQLWSFGIDALPAFLCSVTLLCLCGISFVRQQRAYRMCKNSIFRRRYNILSQAHEYIRASLDSDHAYEIFCNLQRRAKLCLRMEMFCWILLCILFIALRISDARDKLVPFEVFLPRFVQMFSMAIHLGWIIGNGFHAVQNTSLKTLNLYCISKLVFAGLTATEFAISLGFVLSPPTATIAPNTTQVTWIAVLFLATYLSVHMAVFYQVNQLREMLQSIDFPTDTFLPPGKSAEATDVTRSLYSVSFEERERDPYLSRWAYRASIAACLSFILFQIQSVWCVFLHPSVEVMVQATVFGLHSVAVFVLSFYRVVQNYPLLVRERSAMYAAMYFMFALVSFFELLAWWSNDKDTTRSKDHGRILFILIRLVVNVYAGICYNFLQHNPSINNAFRTCAIRFCNSHRRGVSYPNQAYCTFFCIKFYIADHASRSMIPVGDIDIDNDETTTETHSTQPPPVPSEAKWRISEAEEKMEMEEEHDDENMGENEHLLSTSTNTGVLSVLHVKNDTYDQQFPANMNLTSDPPLITRDLNYTTEAQWLYTQHHHGMSNDETRRFMQLFKLADKSVKLFWITSFIVMIYQIYIQVFVKQEDSTGLFSFISTQEYVTSYTGQLDHAGFGVAFHFVFIIFGYTWRGVMAGNVSFLLFTAVANLNVVVCVLACVYGAIYNPNTVHLQPGKFGCGLLIAYVIFLLGHTTLLVILKRKIERHLPLFPQQGFAVT